MLSVSYRATARDCLESSYFKEKPLRKYRCIQFLSFTHFPILRWCFLHVSLCSMWTRADAHISSSPKQTGWLCEWKPVQKKQSMINWWVTAVTDITNELYFTNGNVLILLDILQMTCSNLNTRYIVNTNKSQLS